MAENKILINFHLLPKNKGLVKVNICHIVGQGLTRAYNVRLTGNGHNVYLFDAVDQNGEEVKFKLDEKFICEWTIGYCGEDWFDECESLEFSAFGSVDGKNYSWIYGNGCNDFNHLGDLTIVDITVTNDYAKRPAFTIHNCIDFCDKIKSPAIKAIIALQEQMKKQTLQEESDGDEEDGL